MTSSDDTAAAPPRPAAGGREEAAGRRGDALYRALFHALDAGFCVVEMVFDAQGAPIDYVFVETNPAFEVQSGLVGAAGRSLREIAPEHDQHWVDIYGKVALTGESVRFENRAQSIDGRWFEVNAFRIGPPEARRVAILFNDVTERRRAEAVIHELNATLDQRVAETLAHRQSAIEALQQSQKMEAIGQLTGGVAHDFNNLLTVIQGSVDMLRRPGLPEARRNRYIEAIGDTAERAATLTSQLLAFARRQALRPEVFNLGDSVEAIAGMVATLIGSRLELRVHAPAEPFFVEADRSQFDTAIVNMAINARDAVGGEGRIDIAAAPTLAIPAVRSHPERAGDFVALSVADDGAGIAAEDLERIFEPFFTTKAVGVGTGLGLSQVFGFAKQSRGEIHVESEPGKGSTFTLYLPRVAAPAQEAQPAPAEDEPESGEGVCVLVVEDNQHVGEFAREALAELGYDSVWAVDGPRALDELEANCDRFHIVFSDVVMPGMSGIELAEEIGRRHPQVPVILASGYSHVLAEHGSGRHELLHKPYSVDQLSRALRRSLAATRAPSPGGPGAPS